MHKFLISFILLIFYCCSFAQERTIGTIISEDEATEAYTLFSPITNSEVYLIDNCGRLINSWETNKNGTLSMYLLENGNLLYTSIITEDLFKLGGELSIFDWNGNLIWEYNFYEENKFIQHHDVQPLPNGNILMLVWEVKSIIESIQKGKTIVGNSLWNEQIIEIKPVGNNEIDTIWQWNLWNHLIQEVNPNLTNYKDVASNYGKLNINYSATKFQDIFHFNAIDYDIQNDLIAISSQPLAEIFIIDHSTNTEEAKGDFGGQYDKGGQFLYRWGNPKNYNSGNNSNQKFYGQHDVTFVKDSIFRDAIMVFNNGIERPEGNFSSVEIVNLEKDNAGNFIKENGIAFPPLTATKTYIYEANKEKMYSNYIGGAQYLQNGNVFVCPSNTNFFVELNANNEAVWEYVNPITDEGFLTQGDNSNSAFICFRATKIFPDNPALINKDLNPLTTLENNPILFEKCETSNLVENDFIISPNPVNSTSVFNQLYIDGNFELVDWNGKLIAKGAIDSFQSFNNISNGVYYLIVQNADNKLSQKIVILN